MENSSNSFEICCVSKVQREAKSAFDCDKSSELDWSCKRANFPFGYFTKFTGTALLSHSYCLSTLVSPHLVCRVSMVRTV